MDVKDVIEWLEMYPFEEPYSDKMRKQAVSYLKAIVGVKNELEFQISICESEIVTLTLDHVKTGVLERHIAEARLDDY